MQSRRCKCTGVFCFNGSRHEEWLEHGAVVAEPKRLECHGGDSRSVRQIVKGEVASAPGIS